MKLWQPNELRTKKAILFPAKGGERMAFWFWPAIAAAAAAALAAVLLSTVRIRVRYSHSGKFDQLIVIVKAVYGLIRLRMVIPEIMIRGWGVVYDQLNTKMGKKSDNRTHLSLHSIRRYRKAYRSLELSTRQFRSWLRGTMKKVECTRWRMDVTIGTGDPALTGAAAGLFWTVLGCAVAATANFMKLRAHPHGEVKPVFTRPELTVVCEADFRIRLGTLAVAGIRLMTRTVSPAKAYRAWRALMAKPEPA